MITWSQQCKEHYRELKINPEKIVLAGSSAGANLVSSAITAKISSLHREF